MFITELTEYSPETVMNFTQIRQDLGNVKINIGQDIFLYLLISGICSSACVLGLVHLCSRSQESDKYYRDRSHEEQPRR